MTRYLIILALVSTTALIAYSPIASAAPPATNSFQRTWARTDKPVSDLAASRTWMWGPDGFTGAMTETYDEAPGGQRTVQYFDKSRMEDNSYRASDPWDVTNGLLVVEMMTGQLQTGDNSFQLKQPAQVNVGGDADDPTGPTYVTMAAVRTATPLASGQVIEWAIDRNGNVTNAPAQVANLGVTAQTLVPETNHRVASVFWTFMNSSGLVWENGGLSTDQLFLNPYYATGFPVTEAYWANIKVANTYQWVLIQAFERRVLTYTPGNQPGWQVEAGNVGQHYHAWRYGQQPPPPPAAPDETVWVREGTSDVQVTGANWVTIPDTNLTFGTKATSDLAVTFSGVLSAPGTEVHARAILNGQPIDPSFVVFSAGDYSGPHAFTFAYENLAATTSLLHNLHLEWRIPAGFPGTAYMGTRSLAVISSPSESSLGSINLVSATGQIQTSATFYDTIPNLGLVVNPSGSADLSITLSAEAWTSSSSGSLWVDAWVDTAFASPSQMIFVQGDYSGTRAATFTFKNVSPGPHTVGVRWRADPGTTVFMVDRTLSVAVSPVDPLAGGLATRSSGTSIQTTSGSFVPIPDTGLQIHTPAGSPLVATLSAEASTTGGALLYVRALVDGQPMGPSDVELAVDQFHGTQTFSFVVPQVSAGNHTIDFEWTIPGGETAYMGSRTTTANGWSRSD